MNTEITIFEHEMFGELRITDRDGEPWFVAKDVAVALGYKDTDDAVRKHCDDKVLADVPAPGRGVQSTHLIPEWDMYSLVMGSRLPKAKAFRRWVCKEVLPSIRKTGSYSVPGRVEALTSYQRRIGELEVAATRKRLAVDLVAQMERLGRVGPTFAARHAEHALAQVEGREPVGEAIIDVSGYLAGKGLDAAAQRQHASGFGKILKATYISLRGAPPETARRFVNGSDRAVCCYVESDREIFDAVWDGYYADEQPARDQIRLLAGRGH